MSPSNLKRARKINLSVYPGRSNIKRDLEIYYSSLCHSVHRITATQDQDVNVVKKQKFIIHSHSSKYIL